MACPLSITDMRSRAWIGINGMFRRCATNQERISGKPSTAGVPTVLSPALGQANLSNCEREQIHLAGSIQPRGALLLVRDTDHVVVQASDNASTFLNLTGDLLGRRLDEFEGTCQGAGSNGGYSWQANRQFVAEDSRSIDVQEPMAAVSELACRNAGISFDEPATICSLATSLPEIAVRT